MEATECASVIIMPKGGGQASFAEVPINSVLVHGVVFDTPGELDINEKKMRAIRRACNIIARLAPEAILIFCNTCKLTELAEGETCFSDTKGCLLKETEMTEHCIIVTVKNRSPSTILSTALHELYHYSEMFFNRNDLYSTRRWSEISSYLPVPNPGIEKISEESEEELERWWSNPSERVAYTFEEWAFTVMKLKCKSHVGYVEKEAHLPPELVSLFRRIAGGRIVGRSAEKEKTRLERTLAALAANLDRRRGNNPFATAGA